MTGINYADHLSIQNDSLQEAKDLESKIRKDLKDYAKTNGIKLIEIDNYTEFEADFYATLKTIKADFHSPQKLDIINVMDKKEAPKDDEEKGMEKPNQENNSNKQKENKPETQKNMQIKESGKTNKEMPNKNPKTGDRNDILLYTFIIALSGFSILEIRYIKRKKDKETY